MNDLRPFSETIAIAGQPTEGDLRALKDEGYVGVVNLRADGEPEQPIGTAEEGDLAKSLGLDYFHFAVGPKPLSACATDVDAFCAFLDAHAGQKVLVHCRSGGRAGALMLIHEARAEKWSASEALAEGEAMGLKLSPGLKASVEDYLTRNPPA